MSLKWKKYGTRGQLVDETDCYFIHRDRRTGENVWCAWTKNLATGRGIIVQIVEGRDYDAIQQLKAACEKYEHERQAGRAADASG